MLNIFYSPPSAPSFRPQVEHQETGVKLQECWATDKRCNAENARMRQRIGEAEGRNAELRRRLADAQKYKEQVISHHHPGRFIRFSTGKCSVHG